jgi:phospholipase C
VARANSFAIGGDGLPTATNPTPTGETQHAFRMPTTCQLKGKPWHEWTVSHVQFNDGNNDGFVRSASGPVAMGYWTGDDVPWAYSLAATFPLADRWFGSLLGQTQPNRRYLLAAASVGMVNDVHHVDQHAVGWRNYSSFPPTTALFPRDDIRDHTSVVPIDQFLADAASGELPAFAIIDPDFNFSSEENPQNIVRGEVFAASIVEAVLRSPAWSRTLLVWTFDEGAGYFDHVPPPVAVAPDPIPPLPPATHYDGFARYGFRVPAVVISPWSRPNHVPSVLHDHTSILAMVERKWNLAPLTHRDAAAADLLDFLDRGEPAFLDPPTLAAPQAGPAQTAFEQTGPGQIPAVGSVTP